MTEPMNPETSVASLPYHDPVRRSRPWLGLALAVILWLYFIGGIVFDIQSFAGFVGMMVLYFAGALTFTVWWLTRRAFTWRERWVVMGAAVVLGIVISRLSVQAIKPMIYLVLLGIPCVMMVWGLIAFAVVRQRPAVRLGTFVAGLIVAWSLFLLVRMDGLRGNFRADMHWRWTPTSEERYLASHTARAPATLPVGKAVELRPGDWPGFRGAERDGIVRGAKISLDWQSSPPKVLWTQRVGPGWSSMTVVDGHLYTQEQRGEREAVVCRDAGTGSEIWSHEDAVRFDEAMSGAGPRATPTFSRGRLYAQGTRGMLNCLDAATGAVIWSRDVAKDSGAAVPMWGFCGSPLVTQEHVIVYTAGEGSKGLVAYPIEGGAPVWASDAGKISYSSPQRFTLNGEDQVLIFTTEVLCAVDEATGKSRWSLAIPKSVGTPVSLQPCQTGPNTLVLGHGGGFGAKGIELASDHHTVAEKWTTLQMKPAFNDTVFHDGFVYGFDGTVFCCLEASTGKRRWRAGRYGGGQVVLLADQGVMIVVTEDGQAVLLRCNPEKSEELGRITLVDGKTWNHPAVAQNRLYVRSDAEMACVELGGSLSR